MADSLLLLVDGVSNVLLTNGVDLLLLEQSAAARPITRLSADGYGARRYASFAGKAGTSSGRRPTLFIANVGRLMNR